MAIYGSYLMESKSVQEDVALTIEDINWLKEAYIEACVAIAEDTDYEVLSEGEANKKSWETMKQLKKDFKEHASATKKALRKHDQKTAETQVKALRKVLDDAKKAIKSNKSEASDAFFGFFSGLLLFFCHNLAWIVTNSAAAVGATAAHNKIAKKYANGEYEGKAAMGANIASVGTLLVALGARAKIVAKTIKEAFKGVNRMITDMKNKEASADTLNSFRNECLVIISDLDKAVMELERAVREMD